MPDPMPTFGRPIGPWHRWFAWRPVNTVDRGWRWLIPTWRRRFQPHAYLDGPTFEWFLYVVERGDDG